MFIWRSRKMKGGMQENRHAYASDSIRYIQGSSHGAMTAESPELAVKTNQPSSMTSLPGGMADEELDDLFHALSDATRRDILRHCLQETQSMSRVAAHYPMSFTAVQKHIMVLERAGLVSRTRRGREQLVSSEIAALHRARQALDKLESDWRGRVDRMTHILDDLTIESSETEEEPR